MNRQNFWGHLALALTLILLAGLAGQLRRWQTGLRTAPQVRLGARHVEESRPEREYATAPPEEKLRRRQQDAKPALEAFFRYCDEEAAKVLDETPIAKAIGYARNQRVALSRFLEDGRLPIHNNHSENALRREALGRKNWLFLGSDDGGTVNATFVTLLAS